MKPTRDSTHKAERSAIGWSKERPAAMKVERRIRWEEGEYDAPVTPDRVVFRQKVVGRTRSTGKHRVEKKTVGVTTHAMAEVDGLVPRL